MLDVKETILSKEDEKQAQVGIESYLKRYALNQVEPREVQIFEPLNPKIVPFKLAQVIEAQKVGELYAK